MTATHTTNTVTDDEYQEILEKLGKLQSLSENPGTEGEREAAETALQRLMLRYNISVAQLNVRKKKKGTILERSLDLGTTTPWLTEWKRNLMSFIGSTNFCRMLWVEGRSNVFLIGHERNVDTVMALYAYFEREVRRIGRAEQKLHLFNNEPARRKFLQTFYSGAIDSIGRRLWHARQDAMKELEQEALSKGTSSTALAVIPALIEKEVNDHMDEHYKDVIVDVIKKPDKDSYAYYSGYRRSEKEIKIRDSNALHDGAHKPK